MTVEIGLRYKETLARLREKILRGDKSLETLERQVRGEGMACHYCLLPVVNGDRAVIVRERGEITLLGKPRKKETNYFFTRDCYERVFGGDMDLSIE